MALNLQTLKTRSLTAVVFVVVMAFGLLWNRWSFFILFSVIHFGCWAEFQKLIGLVDKNYREVTPFHKYGVMLAGWCIMLYFTNDSYRVGSLALHSIAWWLGLILVFALPIIELLFTKEVNLKNIGYSIIGLIYISFSWGLMMDLRQTGATHGVNTSHGWDPGLNLPVIVICCMWVNDTMAYMVGSLIGKTPFSKVSPKKTWEGTLGGIVFCVAIMGFVGTRIAGPGFPVQGFHWFVIAAIAAVTGTAGDLLESKLKRMADVKDSGRLMPGHGGFLDRFDSLIIATPFVWLYVALLV